jgi:hypothetical protein
MPLGPTTNFAQVVGSIPDQSGNPTAPGYEGSVIGPCNELSGTRAIAKASFTRDEADELMKMLGIADPKKFHLDDSTLKPGRYCIYYKDAGKAREWIGELDCNAIGDGFWAEVNGWLNPFADYTRCQEVMLALNEGHEPTGVKVAKYVAMALFSLATLAVTGTVAGYTFFKGGDMYQTRKAARAKAQAEKDEAVAKKAGKKGDGDDNDGPGDGNVTGGGGRTEVAAQPASDVAAVPGAHQVAQPSPAQKLIDGVARYLALPDVQADLQGLEEVTVVDAPTGVDVPEGFVTVALNQRVFLMPVGEMVLPSIQLPAFEIPSFRIGSVFRVNPTVLRPVPVLRTVPVPL